MEKDFELELNNHELYQFLRSNSGCKVYWLSDNGENSATFGCNGSSVYFYRKDGTYRRVEMTEECRKLNSQILLNDINTIVRVEKYFDDRWFPVWTSIDGFIETDFHSFAYIGGRYYTFNELQQVIEEVKSLKKVIANLNVY